MKWSSNKPLTTIATIMIITACEQTIQTRVGGKIEPIGKSRNGFGWSSVCRRFMADRPIYKITPPVVPQVALVIIARDKTNKRSRNKKLTPIRINKIEDKLTMTIKISLLMLTRDRLNITINRFMACWKISRKKLKNLNKDCKLRNNFCLKVMYRAKYLESPRKQVFQYTSTIKRQND